MKIFSLLLFTFLAVPGIAQDTINQFDENGLRHGRWMKYYEEYPDQLRYEGKFSHGQEVGIFKFYQPGQKNAVAKKKFSPDSDLVEVSYYSQEGDTISIGNMQGKKRVGTWKYFHNGSDKIMMLENYENGILNGEKKTFYPNGQLTESSFYENGKLSGETKLFSETGVLLKHLNYRNGELHGPAKFYNSRGELIIEGQYKNNKHSGIWKYYENGKLKEEKSFS